jgi:hypothetical protein
MSTQDQFAAKVAELIRQAKTFGPEIRANVMEMLEEARKKIVGELSAIDDQSYMAAQLRVLSQEIKKSMEQFSTQFTDAVNSAQDDAFDLGTATIDQPLAAAGFPYKSFVGLDTSALSIAQGYTADLISGLTKDAAAKLNAAIQRAFLGGQSVSDIIAQVGRAIGGDKFSGLFSPIGARAETIALNEVLRVHSIAGQARLEDLADQIPALQKQWLHVPASLAPRIAHIFASGQVQDVGDPFLVDGEELMYPRDPNGEPENTINCHCMLAPYVDQSLLEATPSHKKILSDLGLEVSATA